VKSLFKNIYLVQCPCEIRDSQGNLLYQREKKKAFVIPLPDDAVLIRGHAKFLGTKENFFNVTPPPMPIGWDVKTGVGKVARIAQIQIDSKTRKGKITLDSQIFEDRNVPEGCKIFMFFHEIGHLKHGPDEGACDRFAFWHALRVGVTPFMCFVALAAYMPESYLYRVQALKDLMLSNPQLKKFTDASESIGN
jgi:hypothetical protein